MGGGELVLALTDHVSRRAAGGYRLSLRGTPSGMRRICEILEVLL